MDICDPSIVCNYYVVVGFSCRSLISTSQLFCEPRDSVCLLIVILASEIYLTIEGVEFTLT